MYLCMYTEFVFVQVLMCVWNFNGHRQYLGIPAVCLTHSVV